MPIRRPVQDNTPALRTRGAGRGEIGNDHILEVLDIGSLPNGERYLVMRVSGRRDAGCAHRTAAGHPDGQAGGADRAPVSCGAVFGARGGDHSSGSQAREHLHSSFEGRARGFREAHRLRNLEVLAAFPRGRNPDDAGRHRPRDALLHVARAGARRPGDGRAQRHLFVRRHPVRGRHRAAAVRGGLVQRADVQDRARASSVAAAIRRVTRRRSSPR